MASAHWRSKQRGLNRVLSPARNRYKSIQFKEIVEGLEPGVHQWLPLEFVDKKGNHLADRYYFIPCNRLDSVDHDQTTMILYKGGIWSDLKTIQQIDPNSFPKDINLEKMRRPFSEKKVQGYYAWRDKHFGHNALMISDELAVALQAENFSGLSLRQADSV